MDDLILQLEDVSVSLGGEVVLAGVTFDVRRGETLCITGPSGNGQTLLLKLCAGLETASRGEVRRFLQPLGTGSTRLGAGFVFEYGGLLSNTTVLNNVALPLRYHTAMSEEDILQEARAALRRLHIEDLGDLLPAKLSLGSRKLASIARAIAMRPQIIYYDEPTLGLDRASARLVETVMREAREQWGATSLIVSHNLDLIRRLGDRAVFLSGGTALETGTFAELSASEEPTVRSFFAGMTPAARDE